MRARPKPSDMQRPRPRTRNWGRIIQTYLTDALTSFVREWDRGALRQTNR